MTHRYKYSIYSSITDFEHRPVPASMQYLHQPKHDLFPALTQLGKHILKCHTQQCCCNARYNMKHLLALLSAKVLRLADISLRLKRQTTLASTFPLAV